MKHYRIANRIRFVSFVVAACLFLSFAVIGVLNICSANEKKCTRYTEITVVEGDTLWALAKEYGCGDKDIRQVIYEICSVNGIKASDLRPGRILLIPQS